MSYLDFLIPFISILFAEFADKTQIAILSLSSKTTSYLTLFFGVMSAFIIIDGLAIYFGSYIITFFPQFWVTLISGLLFLLFGIFGFLIKEKDKIDKKISVKKKSIFFTSFILILFAELGDKSQIASAIFGVLYDPFFVFSGVIFALGLLTFLAIYFGKFLIEKFDKILIERFSNILFVSIGLVTLLSLFL